MKEKVFLIAIGAILCLMAALGYLLLPPENADTMQPAMAVTTAPMRPTQTATPKIQANLTALDLYRTLADGETIMVKQYTAAEWEEIKKMKIPPEKGNEIPSE